MALVSQADFARQHGVSRKTVTQWKAAGYLVLDGGKVDVEATDAALEERGVGRFGNGNKKPVTSAEPKGNGKAKKAAPKPDPDDAPDLDAIVQDADAFIRAVLAGEYATYAHAERIKENALALKHVLDARQKAGALVELSLAERVLFEAFRAVRDSWLNWPARVGPLVAADLGLEADTVTEALTQHVQQHLAELGEPEPEFSAED